MKTASNAFSLEGKVSVVTGGMGLLGRSIVKALAESGSKVVILDVADDAWKEFRLGLEGKGVEIFYESCDITNLEEVSSNVDMIEGKYGPIDVWINNAYPRTADWGDKLENVKEESWRKNIDMQLNSYCVYSNAVALKMSSRGKGSIVNVASIYGVVAPDFSVYDGTGMTTPAAYSAIKGGIIAYSRYLASYFGKKGVRVNTVCPGGISNEQPREFADKYVNKTILNKMADPEEVAWPIVFLASQAAGYITGTTLMVDGGLTVI